MRTIAKITSKGQITIPLEVRKRLGVGAGDSVEFQILESSVEIRPQPRDNPFRRFRGSERVGHGKTLEQIRQESRLMRGSVNE